MEANETGGAVVFRALKARLQSQAQLNSMQSLQQGAYRSPHVLTTEGLYFPHLSHEGTAFEKSSLLSVRILILLGLFWDKDKAI